MATKAPRIVSRADWGANPISTPAGFISLPAPNVWLHHTASSGLHGASGMRSLQANARAGGYVDLPYSIMVDNPDGTLYMSRGIGRDSAATGGNQNATSHAICAMGNFESQAPSDALLDGIASALLWLQANGATPAARLTGDHSQAPGNATACCGRNLRARIADINAIAAGGSTAPAPGPPAGGDDMPADKDFVSATVTAEGAWRMQYDGGVQTIRGPFFGSYFTLPAKDRNDPARRFLAITPNVHGGRGYSLHGTKGETYTFDRPQ
jgi:hypothetical protein